MFAGVGAPTPYPATASFFVARDLSVHVNSLLFYLILDHPLGHTFSFSALGLPWNKDHEKHSAL